MRCQENARKHLEIKEVEFLDTATRQALDGSIEGKYLLYGVGIRMTTTSIRKATTKQKPYDFACARLDSHLLRPDGTQYKAKMSHFLLIFRTGVTFPLCFS